MTTIEEVDDSIWEERECYWIDYYKNHGYNLTNITRGGEYGTGKGELSPRAKLTYPEVRQIKETLKNNPALTYHHGFKELGEKYGVSLSTIHFIYSGRVWTHVPGGPPFPKRDRTKPKVSVPRHERKVRSNLTWHDTIEIKKLISKGLTNTEIAPKFNTTSGTISNIRTGRRWGHVKVPVTLPKKRHKAPNLTDEEKNAIMERFESGDRVSDLASDYPDRATRSLYFVFAEWKATHSQQPTIS
jgi:hypothetical protein